MQHSTFLSAARRPGILGVASLIISLSGAAYAAKPSVPPITVTDVAIDQTSLQAGQVLKVTYTLSAAASDKGVLVEFLEGTTVKKTVTFAPGTPEAGAGTHTAIVETTGLPNAAYTIRVTVPNGVTSAYTNVTDTSKPELHFSNPRGIDINRIAGNPAFGRIYVVEGGGGAVAGRTTEDGVYALNPDLTPAFPDAKVTVSALTAAGYDGWATDRSSSPYRVTVGPDGKVYISDASDPHSGMFVADPNLDTVNAVLFFPSGDHGAAAVMNNNTGAEMYGSIMAIWVEGTGASRKVYTIDEDVTLNGTISPMSILRYDVPEGMTDANVDPVVAVNTGGKLTTWDASDFVRDSQGNFYVVNNETNNAYKFDSNGQFVSQLPTTGAPYQGITIDDARNRIAIASTGGRVFLTTKEFTSVTEITAGTGTNRDVAFDADGWLYTVNSTDEQLYVLAGPGTPVTGGNAAAAQTLTVASPLPGDIAPVGPGGLFLGPNGQRYGDGKVDIKDAAYALRVAAGLNNIP